MASWARYFFARAFSVLVVFLGFSIFAPIVLALVAGAVGASVLLGLNPFFGVFLGGFFVDVGFLALSELPSLGSSTAGCFSIAALSFFV